MLTPLKLDSGAYVIVNRGFVPLELKDPAARGEIEGRTHLTGLMRQPESRNFFTPADDPETDQYFTRDPVLIARHFGLVAGGALQRRRRRQRDNPGVMPHGGATELTFPNNHLAYALTWFGLALALLVVFAVFALQQR